MKELRAAYILAGLGFLCIIVSFVLYFVCGEAYNAVSGISTIVSIVLGVVSIVYTFRSGEDTLKKLNDILGQYESLVAKIKHDAGENNYDDENIDDITERTEQRKRELAAAKEKIGAE